MSIQNNQPTNNQQDVNLGNPMKTGFGVMIGLVAGIFFLNFFSPLLIGFLSNYFPKLPNALMETKIDFLKSINITHSWTTIKDDGSFDLKSTLPFNNVREVYTQESSFGGRNEWLQYGLPASREADFTLAITQRHREQVWFGQPAHQYLKEIARLRTVNPKVLAKAHDIKTALGEMTVTEFQINIDGGVKNCVYGAEWYGNHSFQMKGWYCSARNEPADPKKFACLINDLKVTKPWPVKKAQEYFESKMNTPGPCEVVKSFDAPLPEVEKSK
jgi:hypothetical protein